MTPLVSVVESRGGTMLLLCFLMLFYTILCTCVALWGPANEKMYTFLAGYLAAHGQQAAGSLFTVLKFSQKPEPGGQQ